MYLLRGFNGCKWVSGAAYVYTPDTVFNLYNTETKDIEKFVFNNKDRKFYERNVIGVDFDSKLNKIMYLTIYRDIDWIALDLIKDFGSVRCQNPTLSDDLRSEHYSLKDGLFMKPFGYDSIYLVDGFKVRVCNNGAVFILKGKGTSYTYSIYSLLEKLYSEHHKVCGNRNITLVFRYMGISKFYSVRLGKSFFTFMFSNMENQGSKKFNNSIASKFSDKNIDKAKPKHNMKEGLGENFLN
jgi:hypothetical protein